MKILLTGSSGWLGRFLAPRLRQEGHEVAGLDVAPGVDTDIVGSVADKTLVDRSFREFGIEAVIHAGALHKPDIERYPKQRFIDVNVTGTLNLLEAASANSCGRFVFTSTTSLMISEVVRAGKPGGAAKAAWLDDYRRQMQYYLQAASGILGYRVKDATLVFLAGRQEVVVTGP